MEPILAIIFFVCLSCLVGIAALALLIYLLRGRLRGGMVVSYSRRQDRDVIDADYTLTDDDVQKTSQYTVEVESDPNEITLYPLDDSK